MNCSVCGLNFLRKDKGCQLKECQKCKLIYHRYCYGYNNLDEQCDPCQDNVQKPECYICGQDGLLRRVSGYHQMYVHVLCAIFDPCVQVRDYHTMSFSLQDQQDKKTKEKCFYCNKLQGSIKCLDCEAVAHPHCIQKVRVEKELQEIDNDQWILNLKFHDNNQDPDIIDVDQKEIKNELYDIQEAFLIAIDTYFETQKDDKQVNQFKDEVILNLEKTFKNYTLTTKKEQFQSFWSNYNKIESYCSFHMERNLIFCICQTSINNSQMVQCDYCYEWYHFRCLNLRQIKEDSYICKACKGWNNKRYKIDLDDPPLLNFEDLIIPKEIQKVNLLDVLPLLLYMEGIMRKLPRIPLTYDDFKNLKLIKSILASMPIKPSVEIQFDKILLKQKLQEELIQKMFQILPIQLEKNKSFFEELTKQFRNKGYYFDKDERKVQNRLTRKQMKVQIEKGINDGYLVETIFNLIEENIIDTHKLFIYSNNVSLIELVNRYIVSSNIKKKFKQLFEGAKFQREIQVLESQLELTVYKQYTLMQNQKFKPCVEILIELKQKANNSNITMKCVTLIEELIQESIILEDLNIQNNLQQIIEFPFNSDKLLNHIQSHFEAQLIQEFKVDLESKIEKNCRLTEREYQGLYSYEIIQKAAQESPIIKVVFDQLDEIQNRCQNQKKITNQFCSEILDLMDKCLLTSKYIENQKIKLRQFKEFDNKLKEILTINELEEIENGCNLYGFELDTKSRRIQLLQAIEIIQSKPSILNSLDQYRKLKSGELEQYIKQSQQQIEFIRQFYYIDQKRQDNLQIMLQRVKDITDLDFRNEDISKVIIPEVVFDEISQIVLSFRKIQWRYECQKILNESNNAEVQNRKKKYNIIQVMKLLNNDTQIQDQYYLRLMQKIKQQYEIWLEQLGKFESQLEDSKAPEQYLLIQLINNNYYHDPNIQSKLWSFYIQMIWMQKAEEFLESKANVLSMKILINCAQIANIKLNNKLLIKLKDNIKIYEDLNQKLKEYQEQRLIWLRKKELINNLQTYQSYFEFLENKPDAEKMNEIYNQAKQYQGLKLKELADDLQEVKQVLFQYNEVVEKQPDHNLYIKQLFQIRTCYCHCFLKIQGFSMQLMYNMIKQQSLKCIIQRCKFNQMQERLNEIGQLKILGGEEWKLKLELDYKQRQYNTNSADLKFTDYSLRDDFEWIAWIKESMQHMNQDHNLEKQNKKLLKEEKIQTKKLQSTKVIDVWDDLRKTSRERFTKILEMYKNWKQVNQQTILNLETQIFIETSQDREKYQKEIKKVQEIIKLNKQKNLSYEEIRKIKDHMINKKPQNQKSVIIEKHKQQQQQQQGIKIVKISTQTIPQIICENIIQYNELEMQFQQNKINNQPSLQQSESQIEISKLKEEQSLMNIGELNLLLKKKSNENRESWLIRPSLLTYDHQLTQFFPRPELITVTCEKYSSVETVVQHLTQKKSQSKMIIGWVYSKNIAVAGDLFNLADILKNSKKCIGAQQENVGLTLMYYDFLKKFEPTTKWILMRDQFENQQVMNNLQNYHTLEKFKARLCFVYYIKDCMTSLNTILSQPVDYIDVLKESKLRNIIRNYRKLQKMQSTQTNQVDSIQNKHLEPITKEENKDDNAQHNLNIHTYAQ